MLAIYAPFIESTTITFELLVPSLSNFWSRVKKVQAKRPWLVCEWDGQIVGYAYASEHRSREAYQWTTELSVYVHPDFQKKRVASVLYNTLN